MPVPLEKNAKLHVVEHPLISHKLTFLRDQKTTTYQFRQLINEISLLLLYRATEHMRTVRQEVLTPMEKTNGYVLEKQSPVIIPILRAGLSMVDAFLTLMPDAKLGHIGLARDEETHEPECYYFKVPEDSQNRQVFLCDPMLATGGSANASITLLKQHNITDIIVVTIVAVPEGMNNLYREHPDVPVYTAVLDRELNENAYIVPGLGDAGDRACGTV